MIIEAHASTRCTRCGRMLYDGIDRVIFIKEEKGITLPYHFHIECYQGEEDFDRMMEEKAEAVKASVNDVTTRTTSETTGAQEVERSI